MVIILLAALIVLVVISYKYLDKKGAAPTHISTPIRKLAGSVPNPSNEKYELLKTATFRNFIGSSHSKNNTMLLVLEGDPYSMGVLQGQLLEPKISQIVQVFRDYNKSWLSDKKQADAWILLMEKMMKE